MTVLDSSRWHRIDRALERLLDGKHVDLEAFPPEDRALLDQLLRSARGDLPGLDTPAVTHQALGAALADMLAEQDGIDADARVGPFRIVEQIGAGGMGIVYLARRVDGGFEQRVALKVLADAAPDDAALRLFERERQLLARLEHPGIARLIDGGVTASGRPWFAMEYIDGEPLIDYVEKRALGITGRIHLFLQACDALDHAHRQLILHRDIKPGNLLVTSDGVLKLVDFGLGALLRTERAGQHTDTTLAAGRMTPGYASPEQARGEPVGVASDVFQLGLVLYRLISGCRPYRVDGLSAYQIALAVSDPSIRPPGARWREPDAGQRAIAFGEPAARLYRRLAGDLDNIALKALAGSPERRYSSAAALADDLRRHLRRHPVRARAATRRYRLGRFLQRNRAAAAAGSAFVALLIGSVAILALQAGALQRERDRALESAARAERVVNAMAGMIRQADADNPVEQLYSLGDLLDRYIDSVRTGLENDPAVRARLLAILGEALHSLDRWQQARAVIRESIALQRRQAVVDEGELQRLHMLLAEAEAFDGDLDGAVRRLDQLAARQRKAPERADAALADTLYLRGFLRTYHAASSSAEFGAGIDDLRQALARYRERFQPPHPKIAQAMHALGFKTYDTASGMDLMNEALAITRRLFGHEHATTATQMAELALAHDLRGNPARAAQIATEAHTIHAGIQGETHPDTLSMLSNLAGFHRAAGDLQRAVALYERVHRLRVEILPEDHPLLAFTAHGLGNTLRQLGRLGESEHWLREALRLCRLHQSRNEAVTRENLARTLAAAGDHRRAIAQQQLAVEAYSMHYGETADATRNASARLERLVADAR